ncbi:hypothetical protein A1O3_03678 [Capronia epimyces CBS 606.96]|uniref:Transcription factor domain-containing protein n=1 Tax=Capronia epimyces CBS 606.96 TaxID=1182542 RepID=W9YAP1_9EURO|nr:uncharacterized protein A1O3_03678 [Capronia epimyces CBS 606.96]EXJ86725.1 hypothetical protein A1O3_03678 [Capronia epimyces CBS 606.96]
MATIPRTGVAAPSGALLSGERSQENADQERTRAWEEYRYWALEQPSLTLWKGNSDPFQSAAVGLVARDYEIIRQAQRFPVFAAWPDKASAVFRAPIADTANSHIELQQAMKDEGEIHAILASGYHVTAGSSGPNSEVYLGRELAHKTRAVALLRQKLLDHGFSDSVATLIRLLISLDFEAGDFTASLVHLRGLWSMSSSLPDRLLDTQELIIVSDVWVGLSLLKKPEIPPSRYDPGSRPLQTFDAALRLLEESEATRFNCYEAETSYRSDTVLSTESFSLLDAANEVVNTKAIMDQVNEATIQQDVVWWMHRRATAVSGLLISGYVDAIRSSGSAICSDNLNVRKELDAAACLCGILFMNFRFMDSPNNYNFSKTFQMIEPILRRVSQDSGEGVQQEQDDVFLWLLFMCAMGSDVYAARGDIPYSVWPAREFRRVCARRKVTDEASIITLFRQFEYYPQMDDFVKELLSDTVELLDMPIMPWSKWCEILDHYVP